jgi:hypothetical protein
MPEYRRNRVPGGTFFFTVNLLDRHSDLLVRHVEVLRVAVRQVLLRTPFHIDAWVVLPDRPHSSLPRKRGRVGEGGPCHRAMPTSPVAGGPSKSLLRNPC